MRVLIATIAILASSYAHVLLHSPELRTLENELLVKHNDQIQQWQDETHEAAEQTANAVEEAKWDALESTYDTTWSNNKIVKVVPIAQSLELPPNVLVPFSKTIVSQSLAQSHPSPAKFDQPIIVNQPVPLEFSPFALAAQSIYPELLPQSNLPSPGYSAWLEPTLKIAEPAIAAAATIIKPSTKTIVTQSLSQTHPAPASSYVIAQPSFTVPNANVAVVDPVLAYKSTVVKPETKTIVSQSLTQTHPSPITGYIAAQPALPVVEPAIVEPVISYESSVIQPETKTIVSQSLSQSHPIKAWSSDSLVATW